MPFWKKDPNKKKRKIERSLKFKHPKNKSKFARGLKKTWYFIWYDDSLISWIVNLILAFILIKFIVYPGLGLIFGTSFPIVAVVSGSMEHHGSFDKWWDSTAFCGDTFCGARCICNQQEWYARYNITKDDFLEYRFKNGFNRGDIMILFGIPPNKVKMGDVIVYDSRDPKRPYPIIHRVVRVRTEGVDKENLFYETKGDANSNYINDGTLNEQAVSEKQLLGKASIRIPYLGYIKIWFTELLINKI